MRVYLLIRVSTKDQKDSIEMQKNELTAWCDKNNIAEENRVMVVDEGTSGGKELLTRPSSKILVDAVSGDMIVTLYLSRGFRDVIDGCTSLRRWNKQGISFICLDTNGGNPIDWMDSQQRLMYQFSLIMAEQKLMEVSKTTKKVSDSKKALNKPFARAQFGKTNVFVIENEKRIGVTIQINEQEAKILQYAYDLRQEVLSNGRQRSYAKVAKILNEKGMFTQTGKAWNHGNLPVAFENGIKNGVIKVKELA
jgi:DNA invertase Pin-like site-specific DNA recombinase